MKRTLVVGRSYFNIDALLMKRGAERIVTRLAKSATPVVITADMLEEDFQVSSDAASKLLACFVQSGLLAALPGYGGYRATERLHEYAHAQVLPALERGEAKDLLERIIAEVVKINERWHWNPVMVSQVAVSGRFLSDSSKVPELRIWLIVGRRGRVRHGLWGRRTSKGDGAKEIKTAIRAFGPLVYVHLVVDAESVERPFSFVFAADADKPDPKLSWRHWRDWIQRHLMTSRSSRLAELDRLCR